GRGHRRRRNLPLPARDGPPRHGARGHDDPRGLDGPLGRRRPARGSLRAGGHVGGLTRDRILVWDGCVNVRDLGGLPLEGGGETNFGVLVRADSIGTLTEAGWAALQDYGVTTAVDLRGEHELEDPARARQRPIRVVSIPIAPRSGPGWNWPSMLDAYLGVLEEFRPQFVAAVAAVAGAEPPVVIHCQGGRDRTGLVVALVLRCAGVDPEAIA